MTRIISPEFFFAAGVGLMLALAPIASADILLDVSSTLSVSDPTQLGRLSRNGISANWAVPEPFPGVINPTISFHYQTFILLSQLGGGPNVHNELTSRYVQVLVEDVSSSFFVSAYLDSYLPDSIAVNRGLDVNYLGDQGTSGNTFGRDPSCFQVFVPAGHSLTLVVGDTKSSNGGVGLPFRLLVEGFTDTQFTDTRPGIFKVGSSNANLVITGTNGIGGRIYDVLTSTNAARPLSQWTPIATNVPAGNGQFALTVTNGINPLDRQRFFILRSPTD